MKSFFEAVLLCLLVLFLVVGVPGLATFCFLLWLISQFQACSGPPSPPCIQAEVDDLFLLWYRPRLHRISAAFMW
jgi:nitrate reductase NapE component